MGRSLKHQLVENLEPGQWEVVESGLISAVADLEVAKAHLKSASIVVDADPIGSFQLTYDAARKGIQALLLAVGVRITAGGGHYAFVRVAESSAFRSPSFREFREMRIHRNQVEYPSPEVAPLPPAFVLEALRHASSMIDEVDIQLNILANQ